jgi:DnaJ-class molecular chaperone
VKEINYRMSMTGLNPYAVLGVGRNTDDECIRAAYLAKLKQFPPDRSPAEFERVRDAYELLRDRRRRAHYTLLCANPEAPLESLLDGMERERRFVGLAPWLAVLKDR